MLSNAEVEALDAAGVPRSYPTETMYCIGRPGGGVNCLLPEDGERFVAMRYIRPAPDVGPGRWWALADGITQKAFDAAQQRMIEEFPRRMVETDAGFVTVFDPPARTRRRNASGRR